MKHSRAIGSAASDAQLERWHKSRDAPSSGEAPQLTEVKWRGVEICVNADKWPPVASGCEMKTIGPAGRTRSSHWRTFGGDVRLNGFGRPVEVGADAAGHAKARMCHRRNRNRLVLALVAVASMLIMGLWMSGADWRSLLLFAVFVGVAAWAPSGATQSKASSLPGQEHQNTRVGMRMQFKR